MASVARRQLRDTQRTIDVAAWPDVDRAVPGPDNALVSSAHRRYLLIDQGLGAGLVNLAINAAIAWLLFRSADTVPMWGEQSIAGDTIGTTFFLPLITTMIASRIVRSQARAGRVSRLAWDLDSPWRRLPKRLWLRGAMMGLACIAAVGLPATWILGAAGVTKMTFGEFVLFKATFAAVLAVAVTPLIARAALADGD